MADQYGYDKNFTIYQGKDEELKEKYLHCSLGERVVLTLTDAEWGKSKIIFFDNYFNSLSFLEKLKIHKTLACGTIRTNRKGNDGGN